jgi:hypothetical protein
MSRVDELLQKARREIDGRPVFVFTLTDLKVYIAELAQSKAPDEDIDVAMSHRGIRDSSERIAGRTMAKWVREKISRI